MNSKSFVFQSAVSALILATLCTVLYFSTRPGSGLDQTKQFETKFRCHLLTRFATGVLLSRGVSVKTLLQPSVGDVLKTTEDDTVSGRSKHSKSAANQNRPPLVSSESLILARRTLIGSPIPQDIQSRARTQQLRFTGG